MSEKQYKKFCKITGIHNIFSYNSEKNFYDTTAILEENEYINSKEYFLDQDSILFITVDSIDKGRNIIIGKYAQDDTDIIRELSEFDTVVWVKGDMYCLSQNSVKSINYNNGKYTIVYSDGKTEELIITDSGSDVGDNYDTVFPLTISEIDTPVDKVKRIHFVGANPNNNRPNFIVNIKSTEVETPEDNINTNNFNYLTIFGKGNIASTDGQIILGNFNEVNDESNNYKFIVCNGKSNNERENLFTVSNDGDVFAMKDFVLSKETGKNTHKLSDIHDVTDEDWYKEPKNN